MKKTILLTLFLCFSAWANAQYHLSWASHNISFEVPDIFIINEESPQTFEADAEFYTIEAHAKNLYEESAKFEENIKEAAIEAATRKGLKNVLAGEMLNLEGGKAFYVRSIEKIGDSLKETPVLVVLIIDSKSQKAFEIYIYCHDGSEATGMKIAQNVQYLPKS